MSSDLQAVLPANAGLMNGVGSFTVTLKTVGSQSITATDTVTSSITGSQSGITVNPSAATYFVVSGFYSPATAGSAGIVSVTAFDAYGNVAIGYSGTIHFSSSDIQAVLPVNTGLTNGVGLFAVTLKTAGTQSVTVTDTVTGSITGSQSGIVVDADVASKLVFMGVPSSLTAGVSSGAITVQLQDLYGNPVNAGSDVSVVLSPGAVWYSDAGHSMPVLGNQVTISSGSSSSSLFYFCSTVAGPVFLGASCGGYTSASTSLSVNANSATHLSVINYPSSTTAGVTHSVTVTALDAYGNIAQSFSGTVTIFSSDGKAVLPSPATLSSGSGSFIVTLKTAGPQSITASASGIASGSQTGITVNAASASKIVFIVSPISVVRQTVSTVFTVQLQDQYGNIATSGSSITINLSSSGTSGVFYSNSAGNNQISSITIGAGQSQGNFYWKWNSNGNTGQKTITATVSGWTSITTNINVT
jgi:hypothetical protein